MEVQLPELDLGALTPPLNVHLIERPDQLGPVAEFLSKVDVFVYDIETNIVDRFTERKIRTLQVGDKDVQYVIDFLAFAGSTDALMEQGRCKAPSWAEPIADLLREPLLDGTKVKVGHNLSFEYETIRNCLGLKACNLYDTMISEKTIYCGVYPFFGAGYYGLKDLVARYYKRKMNKAEQKSFNLTDALTEAQLTYGALDVRIPLAIRTLQLKQAKKDGLERALQIQNDAIAAFSEMRVNGMLLDQDAWMRIVESNRVLHAQNVTSLDSFFLTMYGSVDEPLGQISEEALAEIEKQWRDEKDREKRKAYRKQYQEASRKYKERVKDKDLWEGKAALNYGSDSQMLEALKKYGEIHGEAFATIPATNEKILSKYASSPVIQALLAYRKTQKVLSTYGETFLEWVDPTTGRIHPNINLLGAETGRTAATKPNSQNIPKEQRKCFIARPGYVLVTCDMSGAELRIMAELSGDPAWIEAFEKGWDVHSMGAEMIHGDNWWAVAQEGCEYRTGRTKCKCKQHEELRDWNKAINFGVAYGMEKYALAQRLKIDPKEADSLLRRWRESNPVIDAYLKQSGMQAKMDKFARTFSGFKRRFHEPTWARAEVTATERSIKDGRGEFVTGREIGKVYNAAFGSIEREGKNTPIQGGNADVAKVAMGAGYDREGKPFMWHLLPQYGAALINFVHDEFVVECPEENAAACKEMITDCIRRAGAEFMTKVVMESAGNISERWEK